MVLARQALSSLPCPRPGAPGTHPQSCRGAGSCTAAQAQSPSGSGAQPETRCLPTWWCLQDGARSREPLEEGDTSVRHGPRVCCCPARCPAPNWGSWGAVTSLGRSLRREGGILILEEMPEKGQRWGGSCGLEAGLSPSPPGSKPSHPRRLHRSAQHTRGLHLTRGQAGRRGQKEQREVSPGPVRALP